MLDAAERVPRDPLMCRTLLLPCPNNRAAILLRPILDPLKLKPRWFLILDGVLRSRDYGQREEKSLVSLELLHGGFKVINLDDEDEAAGRSCYASLLLFSRSRAPSLGPDKGR